MQVTGKGSTEADSPHLGNGYLCRNACFAVLHLSTPIEYAPGISAARGQLFRKELQIHTIGDFLQHYPLRHVDRTHVDLISALRPDTEYAQVAGRLVSVETQGSGGQRRLVARLADATGEMELVWFQGVKWVEKLLFRGHEYLVAGKPGFFMGRPQMAHPEFEPYTRANAGGKSHLEPVYPSTELLRSRGLNGKAIGKLMVDLFRSLSEQELPENLPQELLDKYRLPGRFLAYRGIHVPANLNEYRQALRRLKFEEFFWAQWHLQQIKWQRNRHSRGVVFEKVGAHFTSFYEQHLPFTLTQAQKNVLKEIRRDTGSGHQMNRLLQGDVGSGKTIVALLSMLLAVDNGYQCVLMAPTEILAQQHFKTLSELLSPMSVTCDLLTGSTPARKRKELLSAVESGTLSLLIGTHAVIEDQVKFHQLGLAVVDEQHKFGVAQRARLWKKSETPPHILVMTATPIPRTLALTLYGDLEVSVINELPPGRKPITTTHRFENQRPRVMEFIRSQIAQGRQAYIIYPLIEESSKVDFENLMKGYEEVKSFFPESRYSISMVHGKMKAEQKETNMRRFAEGQTQILVGTTVIEVGVNVPNASVMVIESAEKFGLSQLHQLRGRVGRGAEQSFCILLTGRQLTQVARERLHIMTETQDGFRIAEKDLELRGPGDMEGTRQSGALLFKLAHLIEDRTVLETAREEVALLLEKDPDLTWPGHRLVKAYLDSQQKGLSWSRIS